jgi:RNA-directed DNA polymerase
LSNNRIKNPFDIPKREVWEAYKRVRANKGTAGVDGQSIADFEADLSNNLYKLWNRMSSGSYYPPPVRRVDIPKGDGRTRLLGIPTVADRVAQTVVKRFLEPLVEPHFHDDSYGYRPNKSALDAAGRARQRCWRHPWVLDLDIKAFFDIVFLPSGENALAKLCPKRAIAEAFGQEGTLRKEGTTLRQLKR